jgi:polar amino acid transport system substrate-binding protein
VTNAARCPQCGASLPSDAVQQLCARCLLRAGEPSSAATPEQTLPFTPSAAPPAEEIAALFPHLQILGVLGRGGMGVVYKARQPDLDRVVALKVLSPGLQDDPEFAERFAREARALARLQHPHVVTVFDSGQVGDVYYLLMEYVDGVSLRESLQNGSLDPALALRIVSQSCDALQYAHDAGVVHRDVKPENVLLTHDGEVKIADFGLAKLLAEEGRAFRLTSEHRVMGTRHYMAPEQQESPLRVDHRADIYSLGVVFYELLTGEVPVGSFAPPSRKAAVSPRLDEVVLKALARDPGQRYPFAGDLKAALLTATKDGGPETAKPSRRRWGVASAAVAGLLVVFALWRHFTAPAAPADLLRWGGDAPGGAPYIIDRGFKQEPEGFEAELAELLADRLGLHSQFVQKDWVMLPQDLKARRDIDVILNGYEYTPQRARDMAATIPYFLYRLQLVVGPKSKINDWDDLRGKRVGVLADSAAHRYAEKLKKEWRGDLQVLPFTTGTTDLLSMLRAATPQIDATVQDSPVVRYYVEQGHDGFGDLKVKGDAVEPGTYVLYLRPRDTELRDRINDVLRAALKEEKPIRAIYEKYGLWDPADQEQLAKMADEPPPAPEPEPEWLDHLQTLVRVALTTVALAFLSMPLAMLLGLLVAVGRLYGPRWLDAALTAYVEVLRGTPLLMQLLVIFYLLPSFGVALPPFWAGVLGLAVNYSAYEAENYRAGILAIPRGQMEAALALGMDTWTALRRVILPQAVRLVIPPVTNDFIALFKDTSVCSVIAVVELSAGYRTLMVNYPQSMAEVGLMTAALYLVMSYPLSLVARRLERHYSRAAA